MKRPPRINHNPPQISKQYNFHFCLLICIFGMFLNLLVPTAAVSEEERVFMKKLDVYEKKQKQALQKSTARTLDKTEQDLLRQLVTREGTLNTVLSSKPYLAFLKSQVKKPYNDFKMYLTAMPTSELGSKYLLTFKDFLPQNLTVKEQQVWLNFYFKMRKLYAYPNYFDTEEKHVLSLQKFLGELAMALVQEPKTEADKSEALAKVDTIFLIARVPNYIARMETHVYHDAWQKNLETYGAREGLLRCAITTPANFALMYSFFNSTEALEKWILKPLKSSQSKKKRNASK